MLRFVLSAVALAGILATANPVFADPVAAAAPERVQTAAPATEQVSPPAPALSSSDVKAPTGDSLGKGIVPVGFGWG